MAVGIVHLFFFISKIGSINSEFHIKIQFERWIVLRVFSGKIFRIRLVGLRILVALYNWS